MLFAVRENNDWLSWNDVKAYADLINCPIVPEIGTFVFKNEKEIEQTISSFLKNNKTICGGEIEGVVARIADSFNDISFSNSVLKWVRSNHVQTDEHWKS